MKHWRKAIPLIVSAAFIGLLFIRLSPSKLFQAATLLPWRSLVPLTLALVVAMYFCDVFCLLVVYATKKKPISYGQMLAVRGWGSGSGDHSLERAPRGIILSGNRDLRLGRISAPSYSLHHVDGRPHGGA
jgi:hypothetical protein